MPASIDNLIPHAKQILKEAALISSRREGQQIWYSLNTTVVQEVMAWVLDLMGEDKKKGSRQR